MEIASGSNLLSIAAQIACVAAAGGGAIVLLRITSPQLNYLLWRLVLAACLAIPWLQTPRSSDAASKSGAVADAMTFAASQSTAAASRSLSIDWAPALAMIAGAGVVLRLAWLTIGLWRLRRLRLAGEAMPAEDCATLQTALGTRANIRYAPEARHPATFGLFRPIVVLPSRLRESPHAIRDAVLAHELVHVRRRDWAWLLGEELVRAIFWCHPAIWWLVSRIQLAREEVVDAIAVATTGRKRDYVKALLAFSDGTPLVPAPAFARRRHLFHRIVLLSTEVVMSPRRVVVSAVALCLVVVVGAWSAVTAFPTQAGVNELYQPAPGPVEQRAKLAAPDNPIPSLRHAEPAHVPAMADSERATVIVTLRTVVDEAGNVAEVRLAAFTFKLDDFNITMTAGAESLIRLEEFAAKARPGASMESIRRPLLEAFIESAAAAVRQARYEPPRDGPVVFNSVVQFNAGAPVANTRMVAIRDRLSSDGALRVGGNIAVPRKIKDVRPVYPQDARDAGVQGVVIIEARIEADGRVGSAMILRSIPQLDQAALDAVKQWEFEPTLLNGVPVPVIMTVTIQFTDK